MLAASAFFAYKIYEHINTLKETEQGGADEKGIDTFSAANVATLIEKADAEMQNGNLDMALAIYSEANIKEPNNDETLFKMGYTLSKQERYEEALEYYKEALLLDKENPFTHFEMANIYIVQKEFASARTHLNAALAIDPEFVAAQEALQKLHTQA
jgi:tetratricopeptide (TPR) repeat protein